MYESEPWYIMWDYIDAKEKKAMNEIIQTGSERAIGIVAVSLLERRLVDRIKRMLTHDEDVFEIMFKADGPIASFATRVRMAYLLGIITKPEMKELLSIKKIRNLFAHNPLANDCSSELIKPHILNLKRFEERMSSVKPGNIDRMRKEVFEPGGSKEEVEARLQAFNKREYVPLPGLDKPLNRLMSSLCDYHVALGEKIPHDAKLGWGMRPPWSEKWRTSAAQYHQDRRQYWGIALHPPQSSLASLQLLASEPCRACFPTL